MKSKIRTIKSDNTMVVDYSSVKKPLIFRYNILSKMLELHGDAIIFVNTNTKTGALGNNITEYFEEHQIENSIINIKARERTIFGLSFKAFKKQGVKLDEKFIMAKISADNFTKEFFENYVATYDMAMAFDERHSVEELSRDYRENVQELYFDKEHFENFLYDSIVFKSHRTTIDVKDIVAECEE